jgi:flavin-dependent thymidylate synthase
MLWSEGHECYDDKTEILSKRGWVLFKDLIDSDEVYAVNPDNKQGFFEKPQRIVSYDYDEPMYYVKAKQIDLAVTKNHRMFVSQKREVDGSDYGIKYEIQTSNEVSENTRKYLTSAKIDNKNTLDTNFAKLIGFFIGDGSASSKSRVCFHLKKSRKIEYLKSLGYNIEDKKSNKYVINSTEFDFTKCYDIDKNKIIPFDLYTLSNNDVFNIIEGLKQSDSHEKGRGYNEYLFSNTSKPLFEQLSILAPMHGFSFNVQKNFSKTLRGLFSNRVTPEISNMKSRQVGKDFWQHYSGKVYCVTVSTGLILVRRNKKPIVCGNTPFEKATVHFLVDCDIASHIHLLKHRMASINAESARYKELKEDKTYIPEDWTQDWKDILYAHSVASNSLYHKCLEDLTPVLGRKRAKESARFFKTYNSQIQSDVMFNMRSFANFIKLRNSEHSQLEIREIAQEMWDLVSGIEGNPFEYTLLAMKERMEK